MIASEGLENFLNYLRCIEEEYKAAVDYESEMNAQTQDILHSIELEKHTYNEIAHIALTLKEVRKQRRTAKDTVTQTQPIMEWIKDNKSVINQLQQILGKVRREEKNAESRFYTPRTDIFAGTIKIKEK